MKKALLQVLVRLALVLIALPASNAFATLVQDNCNAVRAASARGKALATSQVNSVAAAANGSISSQRSCMESFGDTASRAIADLSGLNVAGIASKVFETACTVVVKEVTNQANSIVSGAGNAVGALHNVNGALGLPVGSSAADPNSLLNVIPNNATQFYQMVNNPANAGKIVPWPSDISGFDAATQAQITAWRTAAQSNTVTVTGSNNTGVGPGGILNSAVMAGTPPSASIWDVASCKLLGKCN
jgi:hypothetical protein